MHSIFCLLALAGVALAQGGSAPGSAPAGCSVSRSGSFEITLITPPTKRHIQKRAPALMVSLKNGVLTDSMGRTGYIASNYQFQFDNPPQSGAIYTSGWAACNNGSIALGSEVLFFQCLSGSIYNLYIRDVSAQCNPVEIEIIPGSGSTKGGSGTSVAPATSSAAPVTTARSSAPSAAPVTSAGPSTRAPPATTASVLPISQLSDGQPQGTTAVPPISQISDGQIQGTAPVAPISQISDGQIQATNPVAPISQISDGQVQASAPMTPSITPYPTPGPAPVSQISDGQVQVTTPAAPMYTGAANKAGPVLGAIFVAAAFAL